MSTAESFAIRIVRTEDLTQKQKDEIVVVCNAAHETDQFNFLFEYLTEGGTHFLGYAGSQLASHAVVTTRWLQAGDAPLLRTAYIDAVATLPSEQGRGYSSALLRRLAETVSDFEIACLETDKVGFYARLGWQEWRGPLGGRSETGLVPTPEQTGIMVLRLPRTPPIELTELLTVECQTERIW